MAKRPERSKAEEIDLTEEDFAILDRVNDEVADPEVRAAQLEQWNVAPPREKKQGAIVRQRPAGGEREIRE